MVSGLWHGANWTYIVWGALNGVYLIVSIWTQRVRQRCCQLTTLDRYPTLHTCARVVITFALTCLAWIFFRARTLREAGYILTHLLPLPIPAAAGQHRSVLDMGLSRFDLSVALGAILLMETLHALQRHREIRHMLATRPLWLRWCIYYSLLFSILFFGVFEKQQFIYFQF